MGGTTVFLLHDISWRKGGQVATGAGGFFLMFHPGGRRAIALVGVGVTGGRFVFTRQISLGSVEFGGRAAKLAGCLIIFLKKGLATLGYEGMW